MAGSINKVILVGNIGAPPDIRRLNSGDQVANLRLATSETWRDRNSGERRERTEWHNIVIFNENLVKVVEQYVKKGAKIYIEGQLQTRKWQDQSGQDRYTTEVVLQKYRGELQMLDSRGDGANRGDGASRGDGDSRNNQVRDFSSDNERSDAFGGSHGGFGGEQSSNSFSRDLDDEVPF